MVTEEYKFKRVLEFFIQKRGKDDVLILFDGRGRANRRVIESMEGKLATGGSHALVECWCVHVQPTKKEDPRAAARATSYSINNREMAYFSLRMGRSSTLAARTRAQPRRTLASPCGPFRSSPA